MEAWHTSLTVPLVHRVETGTQTAILAVGCPTSEAQFPTAATPRDGAQAPPRCVARGHLLCARAASGRGRRGSAAAHHGLWAARSMGRWAHCARVTLCSRVRPRRMACPSALSCASQT